MRRICRSAFAALAAAVISAGSAFGFEPWEQRIDRPDHDIVIIHTNDVHCGIDDSIGYAGLASFRDEMRKTTPYVVLADCGDFVQGDVIGAISSGDAIIELMNAVSYDIAICGNHEFDYGIPRLGELMRKSNADWLGCNITYTGSGRDPLPKIKPYKIMRFGEAKVAFIGVSTPESMTSSTPQFFMEGDRFVWSFGSSPKELYGEIQRAVEECRISGADYVVLLTHVGDGEMFGGYSSPSIARNTWGVDAILDGHAHSVIPSMYERSLTGKLVPIASTGTKLANIGRLVITSDGRVDAGIISGWSERDAAIKAKADEQKARYDEVLMQKIATSNTALLDGDGAVRTVRNRETPVASLMADAYRTSGGADIGMVNGGSIRASLPAGDITLKDIIAINPFGTSVTVVKATGQQVLDALEWGAQYAERTYKSGSASVGEFGGFLQVSEIKYTIDTSVKSTVTADDKGMFTGVAGARRVSDVQIRRVSGWEPIDPNAVYTVASQNYLLKSGGDGNTTFMHCELVIDNGTADYMAGIEYIRDVLHGDLSQYAQAEGRITVK